MGKPAKGPRKASRKSAKKGAVNRFVVGKLRGIRRGEGMTLQEAARRSGIPVSSYSSLEKRAYKLSIDQLFRIVQVFRTPIQQVWPKGVEELSAAGNGQRAARQAVEQGNGRQAVRMEDVLLAVSEAFEVSPRQLLSGNRWSRLQEARGACGILVRETSGLRLRSLSRRLKISESSLARLVRRHSEQSEEDPHLASRIQSARAALRESRQSCAKV